MEHFACYGITPDDLRLKAFLNDTLPIPLGLYRRALRASRQAHEGNFPPTQGQVIAIAHTIHKDAAGGAPARWHWRMKTGKPPEFHKDPWLGQGET
jgi:hypothetical protein